MKRHSNRHQLRLISEISLTPLLDLVLVLLFVFLLAAPLLKSTSVTAVAAAPVPQPAVTPPPAQTMTLLVNKDLSVTLNGAMLARADLPASLKQLAQQRPGLGIEVRMHHELPVQNLVETMRMLEAAGIQKTAVTTHAEEP
ncbi:ExbD/TolR family protein [Prosthecobacter sp.]|jgi:biopolymer transport protein TolR|uniref:ExbD/TolR family protein n=1 Tax=Prosthecobacter sp. TaxID=1965333 RepID=UPI003783ACEF